jgi:hypothetical protein
MRKIAISLGALALGVALASVSAFAQGPASLNYGAGSNPQTPAAPQIVAPAGQRPLYNVVPQQGGPTGQGLFNVVPQQQPSIQNLGPAGPGGANYGAGSNPQTGR